MCGFIVQVECSKRILTEDPNLKFEKVYDDLRIRGPDEQNFLARENVFLAHGRLSIIDLKSGQQPMSSHDGHRTVVFNGEIYNYQELRAKNQHYAFQSQSDTEVLLTFEDWDKPQAFLDTLKGMFSFCYVDFQRGRMLIARDRFGKKPLFCGKIGDQFFVSSRLKTIKKLLPEGCSAISPFGLGYFVDFGFIPAPFSMLEGIEKFLPGEWRVYDLHGNLQNKGSIAAKTLPSTIDYSKAHSLTHDLFEEMMTKAVQTRLNSERPIGVLLSDGVDSSIVAKTLADLQAHGLGENIKAIILASGDSFDESKGATEFAKRLGLPYEVVPMDTSEETIQQTLDILDEPFADLSIFPTFAAFKALKCFATVAITGDGGDELFGGYPFQYQNRFLCDVLPFPQHYGFVRRLKVLKDFPHSLSKPAYLYRRLSTAGLFHSTFYEKYAQDIPPPRDRFEAFVGARADFAARGDIVLSQWHNAASLGLSDRMLAKVDVCSMGAGVEARSPFLDEDFWDFVMKSDATQFDQLNAQCKTFLKNYLRPFKTLGAKRGFSMEYSRLTQNAKSPTFTSLFLSDSTSAGLADQIMEHWKSTSC